MESIILQWKSKGEVEMKKLTIFLMCMFITLTGCTNNKMLKNAEKNTPTAHQDSNITSQITENNDAEGKETNTSRSRCIKRMVMVDGKRYVDTGEIGIAPTCGVMDFSFHKTTKKVPTKNGETNFGKGYEGQYYFRNRIIIMIADEPIDDGPWVFAYQENDVENLTMTVLDATKNQAEICIKNNTDKAWCYGEEFSLEYFDKESEVWKPVEEIVEYQAFNEPTHTVGKWKSSKITIKWKWLYGNLNKGRYRIIKEMSCLTEDSSGTSPVHTFSTEFVISK